MRLLLDTVLQIKQGTNAVHGAPLGADETAATRQVLGWDYEPFEIPAEVYADFKENVADRGASAYEAWTKTCYCL